jgi:hypothetical protein
MDKKVLKTIPTDVLEKVAHDELREELKTRNDKFEDNIIAGIYRLISNVTTP